MAHLLVVDDDPDILKIANRVLSNEGHSVLTAQDAISAIELLNRGVFDLLISDANMPLYSGFQLIQTVRSNQRFKNLSIAMLTALKDRKDIEKAVKAGVDDYIIKPLDPLLLTQKVNALLNKRPPAEKPEIRFTPGAVSAKATLGVAVEMESISELGITLLIDTKLPEGLTADIAGEFLSQWHSSIPTLRVLKCDPVIGSSKHRVEFVFLGAQESFLKKVRKWIYSHGASHKAA